MNSQQLLIINFIIFGTMVLFFLLGRSKQKQNITLKLRSEADRQSDSVLKQHDALKAVPSEIKAAPQVQVLNTQASPELKAQPVAAKMRDVGPKANKEVVYFVYNGHEWEAHEVLGIKSGLALDQITQHYQNLIKTSDPSTFEFYEAAFTAVLRLKSNRW